MFHVGECAAVARKGMNSIKREFSHLSLDQRKLIADLHNGGHPPGEIAKLVGVHLATVYRELKKGDNNGFYDPDYADQKYKSRLLAKGQKSFFLSHPDFSMRVAEFILVDHLSISQICSILKQDEQYKDAPLTMQSIYSAIDRGFIPGVTRDNLRRETIRVQKEGYLRIPKWIRDQIEMKEGDEMTISLEKNTIVLSKIENE